MDEKLFTWESEIGGAKLMNIPTFLRNLGMEYECRLEAETVKSSFWSETIKFKFTGTKENLKSLSDEYTLRLLKYSLPSDLEKEYKVESCEVSIPDKNNFNATLHVKKSSKVKKLPKAIADELELHCEVSEKSNGFLKGKTVTIKAQGVERKMEAFRKLLSTYITFPDPKNPSVVFTEVPSSKKMKM